MLLPRTGFNLTRTTPRCARKFAKGRRLTSYSPKVRAFPFALSPEEAMRRVSFVAAATSFRSVRTLFRSFLASMGLGGEVLRPKVVKAAYLPVWFIDGHVGAKVSRETPGEEAKPPEVVNLVLQRSYMSGFSLDPMSSMGFGDLCTDEHLEATVPFNPALTRQHGFDVICLPYSSTPFALEDAAKSLSLSDCAITDTLKFSPTTVWSSGIAAYPILVPVYLMQYEATLFGEPEYRFTIVAEASRPNGIVYAENSLREAERAAKTYVTNSSLFDLSEELATPDFFRLIPYFREVVPFASALRVGHTNGAVLKNSPADIIMAWVNDHAMQRGAMGRYEAFQKSSKHPMTMSDLRIRDASEAKSFLKYMQAEMMVIQLNGVVKVLANIQINSDGTENPVKVYTEIPDQTKTILRKVEGRKGVTDVVRLTLKNAEEVRDQLKPKWKKEWDALQESSAGVGNHSPR